MSKKHIDKIRTIGHEGIVRELTPQYVEVLITSASACSTCHAKGACGMAEAKEKVITATHPNFELTKGAQVMVYTTMNNAMFSVLMAYVIPIVVIVGVLGAVLSFGNSELHAALVALAASIVYFFILYLYRGKLEQRIQFTVEKMWDKKEILPDV
ncbi:hypothetical protein FACS1894199_09680 [Bacteroidia bacterium]|nr:hypothetical protein FACS1894199_09680 [Bacteroidia bacterium]